MKETETDEKALVSRRDMIAGGTLAAGLMATAGASETAEASHTVPAEPKIEIGDNFVLFEDGDDLVIQHTLSGAHFTYNHTQSLWELDAPLDMGSQNLTGVGDLLASSFEIDVETPANSVVGSRSFDTWFTNGGDVPIVVFVAAISNSAGTRIGLNFYANSTQTATTRKDQFAMNVDNNNIVSVKGIVGPGEHYQIATFGDTVDFGLLRWNEYKIGEA